MKTYGLLFSVIIALVWGYILVTDTRVLLKEAKVEPGVHYIVEGYGDLGKNKQASLACTYFNGRKVMQTVFWYAPSNFMGKDSCPFVIHE